MEILKFNNKDFYKTPYEGYYVSKDAEILSTFVRGGRGKIDLSKAYLMQQNKIDKYGYKQIRISINGKGKYMGLHIIIAETFLRRPSSLHQVDHIDRNRLNNHIENLRFVTVSENAKNRNNIPHNKMTLQVEKENEEKKIYKSLEEAYTHPNLNETYIRTILKKQIKWAHVFILFETNTYDVYWNGEIIKRFNSIDSIMEFFNVKQRKTILSRINNKNYKIFKEMKITHIK